MLFIISPRDIKLCFHGEGILSQSEIIFFNLIHQLVSAGVDDGFLISLQCDNFFIEKNIYRPNASHIVSKKNNGTKQSMVKGVKLCIQKKTFEGSL